MISVYNSPIPLPDDTVAEAVFIGKISTLPGSEQQSAILKQVVSGAQRLTGTGIDGDQQADKRYHGGLDKALHIYPAENYAKLAQQWPALQDMLRPGALGENLSIHGWTEDFLCIGDIFALGECLVQISEPREPCRTIDLRFNTKGVATFMARNGLLGWYCRVLKEGHIAAGDKLTIVERPNAALSIQRYWRIVTHRGASRTEVQWVASATGLSAEKKDYWQQRLNRS